MILSYDSLSRKSQIEAAAYWYRWLVNHVGLWPSNGYTWMIHKAEGFARKVDYGNFPDSLPSLSEIDRTEIELAFSSTSDYGLWE